MLGHLTGVRLTLTTLEKIKFQFSILNMYVFNSMKKTLKLHQMFEI